MDEGRLGVFAGGLDGGHLGVFLGGLEELPTSKLLPHLYWKSGAVNELNRILFNFIINLI
jgi:hypothetical protein